MFVPSERVMQRVLKGLFSATRGGPTRLHIIMLIEKKPANMNQIARELDIDYKTVQHHVRILVKNGLVVSSKKKYSDTYKLSGLAETYRDVFHQMASHMGKRT